MRRLTLLAFAVLSASAQPQVYRADLNYIAQQLPRLHANFFFQISPADFNQAVSQLDSQIPDLTEAEFYVRLAGLVAMAGDPHTALYLNGAAGFQQLPLQFRWLDDGVFVTAASSAYTQTLGTQLIAVGGASMDSVESKLAAIIPHTNAQWVHETGAGFLAVPQILQGLDLVPAGSTTPLTFRDRSGHSFAISVTNGSAGLQSLPAPSQGPIPLYLQNSSLNYWFTYSAPLRMLYFKYNRCQEMASQPFAAFANQMLQTLDANPVDTLVFDYRGNGGGDAGVILPLFNGLAQRFPALVANPNLRVYDVIDQGSFSSAMDNAMDMKSQALQAAAQLPGAGLERLLIVIGQSSGGPTSGYGEVQPFTLPSGKMQGQYSTKFHAAPQFIDAAPAFDPDVAVPYVWSDYFARHDPVLAAILARWNGAVPPPSGAAIVVNGASFRAEQGIAAGAFATAYGAFGAVPDQVLVNGQPVTPVAAVASQVNFVMPAQTATGRASISVRASGRELAAGQVTVAPTSPGLFVLQGADPAQPGAILNQDSQINASGTPAAAGSILQIFATGNGAQNAPVTVIIGGIPAEVLYSDSVAGVPGLWQINARLPAGVTGQVPVFVLAGNTASNGVTVRVQ